MNSSLSPEEKSGITLSNIDSGDCGVIAIQAVTGLPRAAALRLAVKHGYKEETGMPRVGTPAAIRAAGFKTKLFNIDHGGTVASFAVAHEYGIFIIHTQGHVMALVEGDLHNSRGFWHDRVEEVWEVTK